MSDSNALIVIPDKHPFQMANLPGPKGPYEMTRNNEGGFFLRLDMPGVPPKGLKIFKKSDKMAVTFKAVAPKKESFPFDESERVYAGVVQLNRDPNEIGIDFIIDNGSAVLLFPNAEGYLFFMPSPRSNPTQVQGKSVVEDEHNKLEQDFESCKIVSNDESVEEKCKEGEGSLKSEHADESSKLEQSEEVSLKSNHIESSLSGKPINDETEGDENSWLAESSQIHANSWKSSGGSKRGKKSRKGKRKSKKGGVSSKSRQGEGSAKPKQDEDSAKSKGDEGSTQYKDGDDSSKSQQGSKKLDSSKTSSKASAEAWMIACIKRAVLQIDEPEPPKEEAKHVETCDAEQPKHRVPEIAIGSVEECSIHRPKCQCQQCDSNGIFLKTWSTTEDTFGHINKLKIKGADGVCEKKVMDEEGWYSMYVRADLPGLEPDLCMTVVRDRCIMVFGKPQPREAYLAGARNYIFFVQLLCSCCKFDNVYKDYEDGVLRLFSEIVQLNPAPFAT